MNSDSKVLQFNDAPRVLNELRSAGKSVVQCHGTFDLLHPGHIVHFEEARALGDVLVVTVTGEKYVDKGPGRPYFNNDLRVKSLVALSMVDYVIVVPFPAAVEAIECVRPDVYCKGTEYRDASCDPTGSILDDVRTVEKLGGKVAYVGSIRFSSTRLLNTHFATYQPEVRNFCRGLSTQCPPDRFRDLVNVFEKMKVLVIGDIIFDRYTTVTVQGLTSKNRILSGRVLGEETQAGGALAVFRHIKQFSKNVRIMSLTGTESWVDKALSSYVTPEEDLIIRSDAFTTIIKQRFVEPYNEGYELSKLFSVNVIDAEHPDNTIQQRITDRLKAIVSDFDLVMVMDFGHGFMADPVRDLVQDRSAFLSLNCQTNSNNHGFNIINRRYSRCDSFSLDETELCLACGKRRYDYRSELETLRSLFGARFAWLTRGGVETIGIDHSGNTVLCPSFAVDVVDTIGAGDAFSTLASLAAAKGCSLPSSTFMAQLAGAQAVETIGNSKSLNRGSFIKAGTAMLTFDHGVEP